MEVPLETLMGPIKTDFNSFPGETKHALSRQEWIRIRRRLVEQMIINRCWSLKTLSRVYEYQDLKQDSQEIRTIRLYPLGKRNHLIRYSALIIKTQLNTKKRESSIFTAHQVPISETKINKKMEAFSSKTKIWFSRSTKPFMGNRCSITSSLTATIQRTTRS